LDLLVPAIDRGADMEMPRVIGCRERAKMFAALLLESVRGA
jgi:hypothetical protein